MRALCPPGRPDRDGRPALARRRSQPDKVYNISRDSAGNQAPILPAGSIFPGLLSPLSAWSPVQNPSLAVGEGKRRFSPSARQLQRLVSAAHASLHSLPLGKSLLQPSPVSNSNSTPATDAGPFVVLLPAKLCSAQASSQAPSLHTSLPSIRGPVPSAEAGVLCLEYCIPCLSR